MKFAKDVSTRVFYMDQGVIYEQGTPEEVFERPQTDRCRAFVLRLKTFHCEIASRSFDMFGTVTQLENFARKQLLGAPLFFASYMLGYFLRSDDQQKLASAGFLVGNGVDILLNLVFVLWLDGGTAGAAWATLLGLVATLAYYAPGLVSRKRILRLRWPRAGAREVLACFRTGLATSSQYAFQMAFLLIANNALLRMAGENGVAVFDMVQNASYLILYLYEGTAKAAQPLVSTFYGEKNMVSARAHALAQPVLGPCRGQRRRRAGQRLSGRGLWGIWPARRGTYAPGRAGRCACSAWGARSRARAFCSKRISSPSRRSAARSSLRCCAGAWCSCR